MTEPLDIVTAIEQSRHIIEGMKDTDRHHQPDIINLAGQLLVAGEIRRLTAAVKKADEDLVSAVRR